MTLLFASQNPGKLKEFQMIFGGTVDVKTPVDVNLPDFDVEETGSSFKENALLKAKAFGDKSGMVTVADDSGLAVKVLDGFPGIMSKRFAGLEKKADRFQMVIDMVEGKDRSAEFVTALCIYYPETGKHHCVEGKIKGSVADSERGSDGFEYDRIFIPDGYGDKTVAELGIEVKNQISARKRALEELRVYLNKKSHTR